MQAIYKALVLLVIAGVFHFGERRSHSFLASIAVLSWVFHGRFGLVNVLLAKIGLVTPGFLMRNFRWAVLVIFVVSAIITPSTHRRASARARSRNRRDPSGSATSAAMRSSSGDFHSERMPQSS